MAQALDKSAISAAQADRDRMLSDSLDVDRGGQTATRDYMASLRGDSLSDLTSTQRSYIENLQAIEKLNPKASAQDIAMAISVLLWEGRIWNRDGSAASVTSPLGIPLVLDYQGDAGYQDVKMSPDQQAALHKQRTLTDTQGRASGVAHTFPAVAAMAGRKDTLAGDYNTKMVTSGGDMIQDLAQIIVDQRLEGTFRDAERRDNERAVKIAQSGDDHRLSESLLGHFRAENADQSAADD